MKRNTLLFYIILLLSVVTAVYANHFYNGFHFDDSHSIVSNPNIRSIKNIPLFFKDGTTSSVLPQNQSYRPVTTTSLAIDYWLNKGYDYPFFFHLSTFILFLAQGLLMLYFFNKLYGQSSPNKNVIYVALFAVAWYLLHPAIAETVNYIIARADVQSTVAVLAGLALYIGSPFCRKTFIYLLPVGIGILAKPPAVMFAPIFFFYILFFEEGMSLTDIFKKAHLKQLWNAIRKSIPAFILCVGLYELVSKLTPKTWEPGGSSPMHYLITQPFVILHYFATFFWPTGLSADTDWGTLDNIWNIRFVVGCLFVLAMLVFAFYTSRKALLRPISFGILWFFIALAPTSSVIPLAEVLNDHRMFFPFVGLVMSVAWTIGLLVLKLIESKGSFLAKNKKLIWAPVILLFMACAYGTWKRNTVWHSEESLWLNVTVKSPKNGRGLMNYGNILESQGKYAQAQDYFNRALSLLPNYSFIYTNIGTLQEKQGNYVDAEKNYLNGVVLGPQYNALHRLYGQFLYNRGRYREAEVELEEAIGLSSADLEARLSLMQTFDALGEWDNLKLLAANTLQLFPDDTDARGFMDDAMNGKNRTDMEAAKVRLAPTAEKYLQLSLQYYQDGKYNKCIDAALAAIVLKPDYVEAYNNVGSGYIALKQFDKAIEPLKKALSIKPDYQLAKNNLSMAENHQSISGPNTTTAEQYIDQSLVYYRFSLYKLCIAACESALEIKPNYDLAYNNLCSAYNRLKDWDDAIKTGQKGLQINPNNQLLKNNLAEAVAGQKAAKK
ncbi:MAG: tetratricopeptide repeat protein [Sphingobacteriales bacterium]